MSRRELRHITVESGRELISGRDQMDDWAIEGLTPVLRQAIESGRRTPVLGGYWIQCQLRDGGLAVGIGHAAAGEGLLISMTVQPARVGDLPVLRVRTVGLQAQLASGAGSELYRLAGELSDMERSIAWAWLAEHEEGGG